MNNKIIIIIVIVIIALMGVGMFLFIKNINFIGTNSGVYINGNVKTSQSPIPTPYPYIPTAFDKENCPKTKDENGCLKVGHYNWSQMYQYEITKSGDIKNCEQLEKDSEIESCKYTIAITSKNIKLCSELKEVGDCEIEIVKQQNDWNACKIIADLNSQKKCFGGYVNNNRNLGEALCNEVPREDKLLCLDIFYFSIAMGDFDYTSCRKISDKAIAEKCLENLPSDADGDDISDYKEVNMYHTDKNKKDTDGDGLGDYDEIFKYKTNPIKSDTDGDGYLDGEEVKNGYNPLGK